MKVWTAVVGILSVASFCEGNEVFNGTNRIIRSGAELMQVKISEAIESRKTRIARRSVRRQPVTCENGAALIDGESFGCDEVDFEGFLSLNDSIITENGGTSDAADIWGWLSPEGREITLWCVDNGMWFIDTTEGDNPQQLGYMVSNRQKSLWCDIKVYKDTAYVVKDFGGSSATQGIQVFNLTRLVGLTPDRNRRLEPDTIYRGHGRCHNLAVDTESGFLYSGITNTCGGGLHITDLSDPLNPQFVACESRGGRTHDAQCVVYRGPDARYTGRQICLAFNENRFTIYDVTDKNDIQVVSSTVWPSTAYAHQGWFTADMAWVVANDELDERNNLVSRTRTIFIDVEDLTDPKYGVNFLHDESTIDHNLYLWGPIHKYGWGGNPPMENPPSDSYAVLSNYQAGIKILDVSQLPTVTQAGRFDVDPKRSGKLFEGTWSNYLHPSGILAVSSIERGLFLLRPRMIFDSTSAPTPMISTPTEAPLVAPTPMPTESPVVTPTEFPTPSPVPSPVPSPIISPTPFPSLPPIACTFGLC